MARRSATIEYNGNAFRTPLEARWAVVFDLLKIPYQPIPVKVLLPDNERFIPSFFFLR
jgi:hypothetical protein